MDYANIPVIIDVKIGSAKLKFSELENIKFNSVIELDKVAGEMCDIEINGQVIGKGELVVVNGNFGVQIKSLEE